MMFRWTEEMIAFMRDADGYSDFHARLAAQLAQLLGARAHVCDAGCGTGALACALAQLYPRVTAVDLSPDAAAYVQKSAETLALCNLRVICGDIAACPPETAYDAMTFCFFGRIEEILRIGAAQCQGRLAVVMKDYVHHRFSMEKKPLHGHTAQLAAQELDRLGVPYRLSRLHLEMGQPFRTLADAVRFFQIYSRDDDPSQITPERVAARLQQTGRTDFPLYLSGERKMGIFLIETENIREVLK